MHIKTRLDLIMDALTASRSALWYVEKDHPGGVIKPEATAKITWAIEKIEKAFEAVNGTEERP